MPLLLLKGRSGGVLILDLAYSAIYLTILFIMDNSSFVLRKIRRSIASVALFGLLTTLFTGLAQAATFTDVASGQWFSAAVADVSEKDIMTGKADGLFHGTENITRQDAAVTIARAFEYEARDGFTSTFTDFNEISDYAKDYVLALEDLEIVAGQGSTGKFDPKSNVNRAAFAKMLVDAIPLTVNTDFSGKFSDVKEADWFHDYVYTLYAYQVVEGKSATKFDPAAPITRYEAAQMLSMATEPLEMREVTETPAPVLEGDLSVYVSPSTPEAQAIPNNGFEIPYTTLVFDASDSDADVTVEELTITRLGLGSTDDFSKVRLYRGFTQIGTDKTLSSEDNQATFALNDDLVVPHGAMVEVDVVADMDSTGTTDNRLGVYAASDVVADAEVGGVFPAMGETMTTRDVTVGTLDVTYEDTPASELEIGDLHEVLAELTLDNAAVDSEDVDVLWFSLEQTGSLNPEDFANLELEVEGDTFTEYEWDGDFISFDLTKMPVEIEEGDAKSFVLYGDVIGGIDEDFSFELDDEQDIFAFGQVYGFRAQIDDSAIGTASTTNVTGGVVNFTRSSDDEGSRDIGIEEQDAELLRFRLTTGAAVEIEDMALGLTVGGGPDGTDITGIKIQRVNEDGSFTRVLGPVDGEASSVTFDGEIWEVAEGTSHDYVVTGDLEAALEADDTIVVDITAADLSGDITYIEGSNETTVADADITASVTGPTLTLSAPTLTVNLSSSSSSKSVVKDTTVDMVTFTLEANEVSDLSVSNLTLTAEGTDSVDAKTANELDADIDDVQVFLVEGDVITSLGGARDLSGDSVNFSGFDVDVPAGEEVEILVRAHISASATTADELAMTIVDNGDFTTQPEGTSGLSSSDVVETVTNGNTTPTYTVTVVAAGTLTAALSDDTPAAQVLRTGNDEWTEVLRLDFDSAYEPFVLDEFSIYADGGNNGSPSVAENKPIKQLKVEYMDEDGTVVTDTQNATGATAFNFIDQSFYVPVNPDAQEDEGVLKVYMQTNDLESDVVSGTSVMLSFDYNTLVANGVGSTTQVTTLTGVSADIDGTTSVIYGADLVVEMTGEAGTIDGTGSAAEEVLELSFTAAGENRPEIMAMEITPTGSINTVVDDGLSATDGTVGAQLLDDEDNVIASETVQVSTATGAGADTAKFTSTNSATQFVGIPRGATVEIVDADDAGVEAQVVVTTILASANTIGYTPATAFTTASGDTLTYHPVLAGGTMFLGAVDVLDANLADAATSMTLESTNGFSLGDVITVRGIKTDGTVIECTTSTGVATITSATALTMDSAACTGDATVDFDALSTTGGSVVYGTGANFIGETISSTTKALTLEVNLAGADNGTNHSIQFTVDAGSDIIWNDEWAAIGDNILDGSADSTLFVISTDLLNQEKGVDNFTLRGPNVRFTD